MKWLFRNLQIIDVNSPFNGQRVDVQIDGEQISNIGKDLPAADREVIEWPNGHCSPGWVDIGAQVGDPGYEYREDVDSFAAAAARGGYTAVAVVPNTDPVIDSKSGVRYLIERSENTPVHLLPLGAISRACAGTDITEMMDMRQAGAHAFTDGTAPIQHAGLMLRALRYVKSFDGLVINLPQEASIAGNGQMHEGAISTQLGLTGLPELAESLMIDRDLQLLEYTGSRLHIYGLSTAIGIEKVRQAKQAGLRVSASVPALNLLFNHSALTDFDSNFKVLPPLRREEDRQALVAGVHDRTIDCITSNHRPYESEAKALEFPYAAFGATGLETAFATAWTALNDQMPLEQFVAGFSNHPRAILGLPNAFIGIGEPAELTFFDPEAVWKVTNALLVSKAINNPLEGQSLRARVLGIFNKGRWWKQS